jgi:hypothetical protein
MGRCKAAVRVFYEVAEESGATGSAIGSFSSTVIEPPKSIAPKKSILQLARR